MLPDNTGMKKRAKEQVAVEMSWGIGSSVWLAACRAVLVSLPTFIEDTCVSSFVLCTPGLCRDP